MPILFPIARHGGKGQALAEQLRQAIQSGRFSPGQRLVESDLGADLKAGRGLLREALRQLAAEGLVELVPNKGAMVRRLTRCAAIELLEIRTELEAFAARRAAGRMGDTSARHAFKRAIAPIRENRLRGGFDAHEAENRLFHRAILDAAGNRQLIAVHERLQLALLWAQIRPAIGVEVVEGSVADHRVIARAIGRGDAEAAEAAVRAHLGRVIDLLEAIPDMLFQREP